MKKPRIESGADIALALKVYMLAEGLSQKGLADLMGYTEASVSRKMRGLRKWTLDDAVNISKALKLTDEEVIQIFFKSKKA